MRTRRPSKHRASKRRNERRPYMIDAEEFDFMDDCEMYDWMFGNPSDASIS